MAGRRVQGLSLTRGPEAVMGEGLGEGDSSFLQRAWRVRGRAGTTKQSWAM